jgi:hypothetical protein
MPIQNVGTLIENIVVTEATAAMLDRIGDDQVLDRISEGVSASWAAWCERVPEIRSREISRSSG